MRLLAPIHQKTVQNYRLFLDTVHKLLSGNVSFADNMDGKLFLDIGFLEGEEVVIPHTFGVIPIGFLTLVTTSPAQIYASSPWTSSNVYLKSNATCIATIFIVRS